MRSSHKTRRPAKAGLASSKVLYALRRWQSQTHTHTHCLSLARSLSLTAPHTKAEAARECTNKRGSHLSIATSTVVARERDDGVDDDGGLHARNAVADADLLARSMQNLRLAVEVVVPVDALIGTPGRRHVRVDKGNPGAPHRVASKRVDVLDPRVAQAAFDD